MHDFKCVRRVCIAIAWAGLAGTDALGQCGRWLDGGGVPGVSGTAYASTAWDSDGAGPLPEWLVVGGGFSLANTTPVANIAAWDGTAWHTLGAGLPGPVKALAVWDGVLYAGGSFGGAVGGGVRGVARFDGSAWTVLPPGFTSEVLALSPYAGELCAGGRFTNVGSVPASRVAAWNGSTWRALGAGLGDAVYTMVAADGVLYVGGPFTTAGGASAKMAAKWDGSTWSEAAPGLAGDSQSGYVAAMIMHNGTLHIGGNFFVTGQSNIWGAARLENGAWQTVGNGFSSGRPACFAIYNGSLIAAGSSLRTQRFNGTSWVPLAGGSDSYAVTMSVVGGSLYTGGTLTSAGGISVLGVARFDGTAWSALGSGTDNMVLRFASVGETLHAGGAFTVFDSVPAKYVASNDGSGWSQTGAGLAGRVVALGKFGSLLVAGGWNNEATRWDGTAWAEFTPGVGNDPLQPQGYAIYNNEPVCVGGFSYIAGTQVNNVARWDGAAWQRFGTVYPGVTGGGSPSAHCVAVYNGELYVGGYLTSAGGIPASRIAKWNGSAWQTVGGGVSGGSTFEAVTCMLVHDNALYIAGTFGSAGGVPAQYIARWDGSSWSSVGGGMNNSVFALGEYRGDLVAGGAFTSADGNGSIKYVARWNGSSWSGVGAGVNNAVYALHEHDGVLHVGGSFTLADGRASAYYARWTDDCCPADFNHDGFIDPLDYNPFINAFEAGDMSADFNGDGFLDPLDYNGFINAFEAGC